MTVRAKFRCDEVTEVAGGLKSVRMFPVINGSEENKQFFQATPGGLIQLGLMNAEAASQFKPGAEYFVDFTPAT